MLSLKIILKGGHMCCRAAIYVVHLPTLASLGTRRSLTQRTLHFFDPLTFIPFDKRFQSVDSIFFSIQREKYKDKKKMHLSS